MFIFGINESINANTNNILSSLLKITEFVRQRNLGGKIEKDILYIAEFGHAVWKLILSIYELG